ncbi:Hypp9322 [Branchiostoma lanceolatum]|uniref:Hypp9322 protein n=1 Tax=Branchiostoma lanceolatum TaxID=7740 RepID=A0A8S4MMC6_BRALA|nr:Hypp9322 [Branchiostoma lanceolatum]
MEDLWRQHTEEMALLEGSTFTINEAIVTFEFVPSADQKWQCWANNETTNAATFPSPFADVSKETMAIVNGQIGEAWQPWTHASRTVDAAKVTIFPAEYG